VQGVLLFQKDNLMENKGMKSTKKKKQDKSIKERNEKTKHIRKNSRVKK
jgi:hypothetical protein